MYLAYIIKNPEPILITKGSKTDCLETCLKLGYEKIVSENPITDQIRLVNSSNEMVLIEIEINS